MIKKRAKHAFSLSFFCNVYYNNVAQRLKGFFKMARPTVCIVDTNALKYNFEQIKKRVQGKKVLVPVKADAYGHGLCRVADALKYGADYFGVATLEEGKELREYGIKTPVLCLDPLPAGSESIAAEYKIDQAVCTPDAVFRLEKECKKQNKQAGVHIKIETGMHRTGTNAGQELEAVLGAIKGSPHIHLDGVFTHFYESDIPDRIATDMQGKKFMLALEQVKNAGFEDFIVHCANSGAVMSYPEYTFDMVRPGILIYGYLPSRETKVPFKPKRVLTFKTEIVAFTHVKKGETVGYSATFTAQRDTLLAVLPVGYGDGYKRLLSNKGEVLISGKRAGICGNICMDMTLVDVTDIPDAKIGSEAVLIGQQGEDEITADEIAEKCQTISYEIMLSITGRVPKIYE